MMLNPDQREAEENGVEGHRGRQAGYRLLSCSTCCRLLLVLCLFHSLLLGRQVSRVRSFCVTHLSIARDKAVFRVEF